MQYRNNISKLDKGGKEKKKKSPALLLCNATPLIVHAKDVAVPF